MAFAPLNGAALNGRRYTVRPVPASVGAVSAGTLAAVAHRIASGRAPSLTQGTCTLGPVVRLRGGASASFGTSIVALGAPQAILGGAASSVTTAVLSAVVPRGRSASVAFTAVATLLLSVKAAGATLAATGVLQASPTRRRSGAWSGIATAVASGKPHSVHLGAARFLAQGFFDPGGRRAFLYGQAAMSATALRRVASFPFPAATTVLVARATRRHGSGAAVPLGQSALAGSATVNLRAVSGIFIYTSGRLACTSTVHTKVAASAGSALYPPLGRALRRAAAGLSAAVDVSATSHEIRGSGVAMDGASEVYFSGYQSPLLIVGLEAQLATSGVLAAGSDRWRTAKAPLAASSEATSYAWVDQAATAELVGAAETVSLVTLLARAEPSIGVSSALGTATAIRAAVGSALGTALVAPSATRRVKSQATLTGVSSARGMAFINFATAAPSHRTAYVAASYRGIKIPAASRQMRV